MQSIYGLIKINKKITSEVVVIHESYLHLKDEPKMISYRSTF